MGIRKVLVQPKQKFSGLSEFHPNINCWIYCMCVLIYVHDYVYVYVVFEHICIDTYVYILVTMYCYDMYQKFASVANAIKPSFV